MSTTKKRCGDIDFLRFVFSIVVILRHSEYLLGDANITPFTGGAFAVEFFFLVSGYLMMASIDKARQRSALPEKGLGTETLGFMKKSICPFSRKSCFPA